MAELQRDTEKEEALEEHSKGGLKTIPFIMANEILDRISSTGLSANMIIYLTGEFHMKSAAAASTLFIWMAASHFTPILGAFLSDSYLGRFWVIACGSIISLIGMILLWLTASLPNARPQACSRTAHDCKPATTSQLALLFSSFALMAVGSGGIRPCSLAFGADQLNKKGNPTNQRTLQTFFNWYYASAGLSVVIAATVIVYIQDKKGFNVGFGVPVVLMVLSVALFLLGACFYINVKANKSMFSEFAGVLILSYRRRRLPLPAKTATGMYHHNKGSNLIAPSDNLRFLNKACIVGGAEKDMKKTCTVEQVEKVKSVLRVIPIWSTGIVFAMIVGQYSFPVLQAKTMDRHISKHFEIPAGSLSVFGVITLIVWVAIYDRLLVPQLAQITGRPSGLSFRQRMGCGLLISCMAMGVASIAEGIRRRTAIKEGFAGDGKAVLDMSAMWLVPQHCLMGLAEAFNLIGQVEFYYYELPKSMASIAVALLSLGSGFGSLLGSLLIDWIDEFSGRNGRISWLSSNLNQGHYDYYYCILALLSVVNFFYFLVCSWCYGEEGANKVWTEDEEEMKEGDKSVFFE